MRNKDATPPLDREYPYENEGEKKPENAWPEWLQLQPGLTPVYVSPPNPDKPNRRSVAVLGRFHSRPYLLLKIFHRKRGRGPWRDAHYSAFFDVEEFRTLCLRLNDIWQRRLDATKVRPAGRRA